MYKTVLVKEMIEDGARLLRKLDECGIPVRAAAWFDDPEKSAWKLVIVTSVAADPGPLEAYMQVQNAMAGMETTIALDDITLMSPASRTFEEFKRNMEGVVKGSALHPKDPAVGVSFDDAYVYRWLDR